MTIKRSKRVRILDQIPLHYLRYHIQLHQERGDDEVWVCPLPMWYDAKIRLSTTQDKNKHEDMEGRGKRGDGEGEEEGEGQAKGEGEMGNGNGKGK